MGIKSQAEGLGFEELFKAFCNRQGFSWIKIPTGAKIYGQDQFGNPKYRLTRSPFDFAIAGLLNGQSVAAYLDCKTVESGRFSRSLIDWNQVDDLEKFDRVGHPAGYLIFFRQPQKLVFFKASTILQINHTLTPDLGLFLGDLYSFDLSKLWK